MESFNKSIEIADEINGFVSENRQIEELYLAEKLQKTGRFLSRS